MRTWVSVAVSAQFVLGATIALAQTPVVAAGGVVDAATFRAPVAPGSLVSIFGTNLASGTASAGVIPLPTTLGHVSVSFNGIAAPLLYVSAGQINVQLPWELSASDSVSVVVTNGSLSSAPQAVQIGALSPGLFAIAGHAVAINPDGSLAAPAGSVPGAASHPATPGDTLMLLASGLGPVNPAAITGNNSLDGLRRTTTTPTVLIGGASATVSFAGLSPQFVGVYQINVTMPSTAAPANDVPLQIEAGGSTSTISTNISVGSGWPQWGQNAQHNSSVAIPGQSLKRILASVVYDPLTSDEVGDEGYLGAHFQAPLVDGNDVYMEFESGTYDPSTFATTTWGETKFTWRNGQLVPQWQYASDWKPPGFRQDFWEPVFHPALANDSIYLPGASGSIIRLNKLTGAVIGRIAPFGTDPNTYDTGPLTVDSNGNIFYNVIQGNPNGFAANDTANSWLVKASPDGAVSKVSYLDVTSPEAPGAGDQCATYFDSDQLPWPPSSSAMPRTGPCGSQRAGLNVSPAIGPNGTIYTVSRAHFNERYAFLIALNPDLSRKWLASLRNRFHDGCGVPVAAGGWLPPNGTPGGCREGASQGVDPSTNQPGDGSVIDSSSATPVVAPDGTILFGTWNRYNYDQGHLVHFDANGNYLGAFGFGWDTTPAIYMHDGTWSVVTKNNHYGVGSYCDNSACPPDRTTNNPASPEQYFVTQLDANLNVEWNFQSTNTQSCVRNADGSISCTDDHPAGFEWCVNSPVVDANGIVYANSEDGNLYAIGQGGMAAQMIFQQFALGAAYTPASLGGDGKIYSQNDGYLFAVGN